MRRVVFRPEAENDLIAIALHVKQHSTSRALNLVARLRKRCDMLLNRPEAGRPRTDLGENLRSLTERPYVLIYRLSGDDAEIVAVLHGARDLPKALANRMQRDEP